MRTGGIPRSDTYSYIYGQTSAKDHHQLAPLISQAKMWTEEEEEGLTLTDRPLVRTWWINLDCPFT